MTASRTLLFAAAAVVLCALPAQAGIRPTLSQRAATYRADAVVLAEVVKIEVPPPATQPDHSDFKPTVIRFKVAESLSGQLKPGDEVRLELGSDYRFDNPFAGLGDKPQPRPDYKHALLYLRRADGGYQPVASGIRLSPDGKSVYVPLQWINPGPYFFTESKGPTWPEVVASARQAAKDVAGVRALLETEDPAKRNRALLDWARKHKDELRGGWWVGWGWDNRKQPDGWGFMTNDMLERIMGSYRVGDCWEAARLAADADLNIPYVPCFATPAARKMLMDFATDVDNPANHRACALNMIAQNCWPGYDRRNPHGLLSLDAAEQARLLDALLPRLADKEEAVRESAARVIAAVSMPYDADGIKKLGTRQALPALVDRYRIEPSASVKYRIECALERLAGERNWRPLTQPDDAESPRG